MKRVKIVGKYIRERREALNLSQKALGLKFEPAVTTQFISNVERGVTPLPPSHVPTLCKALMVTEAELMSLLEREYAMKLSGRLGHDEPTTVLPDSTHLVVHPSDFDLMQRLYDGYRKADESNRKAFLTLCESVLGVQGIKPS